VSLPELNRNITIVAKELMPPLDNKVIANVFYEVADLLEIDNADSFRIRSYRRAAEAVEGSVKAWWRIFRKSFVRGG
jgi:hypothetical protein